MGQRKTREMHCSHLLDVLAMTMILQHCVNTCVRQVNRITYMRLTRNNFWHVLKIHAPFLKIKKTAFTCKLLHLF